MDADKTLTVYTKEIALILYFRRNCKGSRLPSTRRAATFMCAV